MNFKEMDPEKKLLMARDVTLAYFIQLDFTREEAETVLDMCRDEINAWEKRSRFDVM